MFCMFHRLELKVCWLLVELIYRILYRDYHLLQFSSLFQIIFSLGSFGAGISITTVYFDALLLTPSGTVKNLWFCYRAYKF